MTLTVDSPRRVHPPAQVKRPPRRDIQGLRALAVTVVIVDHLFGWPAGGFIGVDVFFVISGFLITGLLYREHQATGRISFARFYRRRARRILPISSVVLAVTVAASFALYLTSRAREIGLDALWAFVFSANWHFAAIGTDYLANDRFVSPVQHYWSLAVEEQFYVVWPWLLVAALGLGLRRHWQPVARGRALFVLMAAVSVASFGWALRESVADPTWAYFSTFARAWELGVGAMLAVAAPALSRLPSPLRPLLAWVGLLGIVAGLFLVTERSTFPAPWAALPVVSTALVLAAGAGGHQRGLFLLTNRVSTYIGDISYSLYLWHFPVIVLLGVVLSPGTRYDLFALGLMCALSVGSYHLVERPVRSSSWLEPGARRAEPAHRSQPARDPAAHRTGHPHSHRRGLGSRRGRIYLRRNAKQLAALAATFVVSAGLVAAALQGPGPGPSAGGVPVTSGGPAQQAASTAPADLGVALTGDINAALRATTFPRFSPSIDSLGIKAWSQQVAKGGCFDINATNVAACSSGTGTAGKSVAVLGDSYAVAWMPAIRKAFEGRGWKVHSLTEGQCPAISVSVTRDGGAAFPECDEHRRWAVSEIARIKPDLVILADADNTLDRLTSHAKGTAAAQEVAKGTSVTLAAIRGHAAKAVLLSPPPAGVSLQDCVTRVSKPANCVTKIDPDWWTFSNALKSASVAPTTYVDTHLWFCNAVNLCPGFVGTTPVRVDGSHLSVAYSESLAPLLVKTLTT